ncbi:MAG TPA: WecB/TagA/CpsF family glycosyltransferase, partial [bacterium]|nr:WecB/TagA/CpsF family glycosyltransferase [bacterium]
WNGTPLKQKVAGADLLPLFCERAAQKQHRVFLLGGTEGVPERAANNLCSQYPGLRVVGTYSPPLQFEQDPIQNEKAISLVRKASPEILFVALGTPRQEKWLYRNLEQLRVPVCIGVGAGIDFAAGEQKRAPLWIQRHGLEWLYRFIQEPRKIWRRVLISIPLFIAMFIDLRTYSTQKRSIGMIVTSVKLVFVAALILLSYCFSVWIRHSNAPPPFLPPWTGFYVPYQNLMPIVILSYLFACLHFGFFRSKSGEGPLEILKSSFMASSLGTVAVLMSSFLFKEIYIHEITGFSRISIGLTWFISGILFFAWRITVWLIAKALARNNLLMERILIVGTAPESARFIRGLCHDRFCRVKAIGIVVEKEQEAEYYEGLPIL